MQYLTRSLLVIYILLLFVIIKIYPVIVSVSNCSKHFLLFMRTIFWPIKDSAVYSKMHVTFQFFIHWFCTLIHLSGNRDKCADVSSSIRSLNDLTSVPNHWLWFSCCYYNSCWPGKHHWMLKSRRVVHAWGINLFLLGIPKKSTKPIYCRLKRWRHKMWKTLNICKTYHLTE